MRNRLAISATLAMVSIFVGSPRAVCIDEMSPVEIMERAFDRENINGNVKGAIHRREVLSRMPNAATDLDIEFALGDHGIFRVQNETQMEQFSYFGTDVTVWDEDRLVTFYPAEDTACIFSRG